MDSFCFRPTSEILKPFLVNGNRSRTWQTQNRYNKYYTNLLFFGPYCKLRIPVFSPTIYGPRDSRLGHKSKGKIVGP